MILCSKLFAAVLAVGTTAGVGGFFLIGDCGRAKSCAPDQTISTPAVVASAQATVAKPEGACGDKAASCGDKTAAACGDKTAAACGDKTVAAKTEKCCGDKSSCGDKTVSTPAGEAAKGTEAKKADGHVHTADCGHGPKNLVATVAAHPELTTLAGLLKSSGLDKELAGETKFTILAPTDAAFAKLSESELERLSKPENKGLLRQVLVNHVVAGELSTCCAKDGSVVKAFNGSELKVTQKEGKTAFSNATVVGEQLKAANGVVMAIDTVLLPAAPISQG